MFDLIMTVVLVTVGHDAAEFNGYISSSECKTPQRRGYD